MRHLISCIFAGLLVCTLDFGAARADDFTITYELDDGTNYVNAPASYTEGIGATIDGIPTKADNVFAGWCTDSALETCAITQTIDTNATGNKTFYAKWTACPACATINATCTLSVINNTCTYTTACEAGYDNIINNGAFNASCGIPTCIGATFYDTALEDCTPCPTGYNVNTTPGKTDVTQCQTQCAAGTFVEFPGIYGYTHIEYLESDGKQFINTGFTHPAGTTNVRGEIRIGTGSIKINKNVNFLGNQTTNVGGYSVGWAPSVFKLWMEVGGGRLNSAPQDLLVNSVHDLSFEITPDTRYLTTDGDTVEGPHTGTIVTNTPIHLFDNGMHQTEQIFIGRMYYIRLYENGVLAHNFLPVRENATGRVGVYDTVTGRFFTNSGTDEFSYGDDVTTICENVGTGHYVGQQVVNFGSVGIKKACPAGTYSDIENATSLSDCTPCQGATYSSAPGAAMCSTCPTGYNYNKTNGKTSVTQCQIHCDGGQYLPMAIVGPYTELEYIQTSGTQWINTDLMVSNLTNPIMSMTFQYLDTTKGKQTGAVKEPQSFKFGISNGGQFLCQSAGSNSEVTFGPADTEKHTFLLNSQNATCKLDDTTLNLTVGNLSNLTGLITVGSVSANKQRVGNVKIYDFELISNNSVVRHLIPARRNSDNLLGMYDTVNDEFYSNAGTGSFVAGDDVNIQLCTNVGIGYWAPESVTNYGNGAPRTACEDGKTTMITNATSASQCVDDIQEYTVTYSCGAGTGNAPSNAIAKDATSFTPAANSCSRNGYIFTGWGVSDTQDIVPAGVAFVWEYDEDKTLTAQWSECEACNPTNATCSYTGIVNNVCTYTTTCDLGYGNIQNDGQYNPICTLILCENATYMNNGVCTPCPAGYNANTTPGKTANTQCQIHCDGGSYIATANDTSCSNVGVGYWAAESTINYGSVGTHTACPAGLTTVGYGHGADEENDCGRKLHIDNTVFYTRRNKVTTPSLNFMTENGDTFYLSLSTTNHNLSRMHANYQGINYTAYDDSLIHNERTFE